MLLKLKKLLEENISGTDYTLKPGVKVKNNSMVGKTELKTIYKKKNSWKICDAWFNEHTIFSLPLVIQQQIYQSILTKEGVMSYEQIEIYDVNEKNKD